MQLILVKKHFNNSLNHEPLTDFLQKILIYDF